MEVSSSSSSSYSTTDHLLNSLSTKGWSFSDLDQVRAIMAVHSAQSPEPSTVDSIESELCNVDLRSIGGKSLPDPSLLRKSSYVLQPPKVLQIASVRDISKSSMVDGGRSSSNRRVFKMILSDGHSEVTAIEYSPIPCFSDNVVPGTKVRLEKKAAVHCGIVCLTPDVITVLGGVVQSLYEEWQMNQKYSGFSRSSLRLREGNAGDPPPFEKLQIGGPKHGFAGPRNGGPAVTKSPRDTDPQQMGQTQASKPRADAIDSNLKTAASSQLTEEKPTSSDTRAKEVAEYIPIQNQAASQKLLQRMNQLTHRNERHKGQRYKGKGREDEKPVFTLDEWERRKAGATTVAREEPPDLRHDEDLAWQLQNQFDLEDQEPWNPHVDEAEHIRMSMFSYERDNGGENGRGGLRGRGRGRGGRGRGRGRGRGKGRGRGRGRG